MNFIIVIYNEFTRQSINFEKNSKATRSKRIQTIFKNAPILICCIFAYVTTRFVILFIEESSKGANLAFSIFLPMMFFINIMFTLYIRKNPVSRSSKLKYSIDIIRNYENNIGFYSSLMSFWVSFMIPFTLYFENDKFDKGIQFMMSKLFLTLTDIILMQPKFHSQFIEIVFTLSYLLILSMKSFSFINSFFASAACTSTFFIFYIAEQLNFDYNNLLKKKKKIIKLNHEIFKMIKEPILIIYNTLTGVVFKNEAFIELQRKIECNDEIDVLHMLTNEKNTSLKDDLLSQKLSGNNSSHDLDLYSVYSINQKNKKEKKQSYLIRKTEKKLKQIKENVIGIYFHDIGNEIEIKVLEENVEFTNLMLYSLSHEIRTPLNGMQGILQLIIGKTESQYNEQIKIALSCSEFLVTQINCMLDYSQIINNEFKLHLDSIDLKKYFKALKGFGKAMLVNSRSLIKIKVQISENIIGKVIFDPERVKQIFLNLLTNAVKYTEYGVIIIGAKIIENNELELSLSDTGCGFLDDQVKMFNRESNIQIIKYDKEKKMFPGYKLSICKLLCQKLKTKMILASEKGKGSLFSFRISLQKLKKYVESDIYKRTESGTCIPEAEEINLSSNIRKYLSPKHHKTLIDLNISNFQSIQMTPKSVIIADDVVLNRFVISEMIRRCHFTNINEATNGLEALELAKSKSQLKEDFLIFMDIDMPIMGGLESTKRIREFSNNPIIAVTAFIGEEMRSKAKACGMTKFITKPISFEKICSILKEYQYI